MKKFITVVYFIGVTSCKPSSSVVQDVSEAYTGKFHLTSDMFVPYSNIGYDEAFCAGTSTIHAMMVNRARFHDANPPSLKCPSQWTAQDDRIYESAVWSAIQQESIQRNFTGSSLLNIYAAKNFNEFGTRSLDKFSSTVRNVQAAVGSTEYWSVTESGQKNFRFVDFREIVEKVRAGNIVIVFAYATTEDPDPQYSGTIQNLKSDCEVRGYVWDVNANDCDWKTRVQDRPAGNEQTLSLNEASTSRNTIHPDQDRSVAVNHAVLVTGAFDDDSLQVYTTWDQELKRWGKDLKVDSGRMGWMINPIIAEVIPVQNNGSSQAADILKHINDKYAYTGPNAAKGCPGTGGNPVIDREENYRYDSTLPPNVGGDQSSNPLGSADPFYFEVTVFKNNNRPYAKIFNIQGCKQGKISWAINSSGYNQNANSSNTAGSNFSTDANIISATYPLDASSNKWQITGTCTGKRPYSAVFYDSNINAVRQ